MSGSALEVLNQRVVACERCARLREHCTTVAEQKRRAYLDWEYWGKPVPSFGDPRARVLFVGLAPGAHGSNRTGRIFTGDGSGDFLYPLLHRAGFASQASSKHREDGMILKDAWITAVVRCAPPGNKPLPEEIANCAPFLDEEIAALDDLRVIVCLGKIGFDGVVAHLMRTGQIERRGRVGVRARSGIPDSRRSMVAGELSSVAAKHEYGQADSGDDAARFSKGAATRGVACNFLAKLVHPRAAQPASRAKARERSRLLRERKP